MAEELYVKVSGRFIEHLGIQMYQSPVAAIAELIANAWDADAHNVEISLPSSLDNDSTIVIHDDGIGMTTDDCQERYLKIGADRRGGDPNARTKGGRHPMGRKGIGKFAGFGIARFIGVDTIAEENGEGTQFKLDYEALIEGEYITGQKKIIKIDKHLPANSAESVHHRTQITLSTLSLKRQISVDQFARSLARRFVVQTFGGNFNVQVNGKPLPPAYDSASVEYSFPKDYTIVERPTGLDVQQDFGEETLIDTNRIRWRFMFLKEPINDEEQRGISVFVNGKLAQVPFLFKLSGGLSGQAGVEYLFGEVHADYIDTQSKDLIATDRQGINWEDDVTRPLLEWGQERIKSLLTIWKKRRNAAKENAFEVALEPLEARLSKLTRSEQLTVKSVLKKLASLSRLSRADFETTASNILRIWEKGRLRELFEKLQSFSDASAEDFLTVLAEAEVLTAINSMETIRTKLQAIALIKQSVSEKKLENAVRDQLAEYPWIFGPQYETFAVERATGAVLRIVEEAAQATLLNTQEYRIVYNGRVDLVLRSGNQLLVAEFMRPGLNADWDHLSRIELYISTIRTRLKAMTHDSIPTDIVGIVIADGFEKKPTVSDKIQKLKDDRIYSLDWDSLLANAEAQWKEFQIEVITRAPKDSRVTGEVIEIVESNTN